MKLFSTLAGFAFFVLLSFGTSALAHEGHHHHEHGTVRSAIWHILVSWEIAVIAVLAVIAFASWHMFINSDSRR